MDLDRPDDSGDDPFAHLPPELRELLERLAGPGGLDAMREQLEALLRGGIDPSMLGLLGQASPYGGTGAGFGFQPVDPAAAGDDGPVDWTLATRVALQLATDGDRSPTDVERGRAQRAFELAEHWLDETPLPAPADGGRVVAATRQEWVNTAVPALRPLVEPVARAATDGLVAIAGEQLDQLAEEGPEGLRALAGEAGLPPGLADLLGQVLGGDPAAMLRPAGRTLAGLQAGQVLGQLASQLLGQYELGIPTGPRAASMTLAVNVADAFEGYDLDDDEVAVVLALTESAHRRIYQATPWLEAHVASLVGQFAAGTTVDASRLREVTDELLHGIDPADPDALSTAMERAASFRLTPTAAQRRVLERLQGVVCLVGAWARHEVARASAGRLPSLARIEEVLRRHRAVRGDGDDLLAGLLGLDLRPDDERLGERFVAVVEEVLGPGGLHRALAHPDYLPDADELAEPGRWLERTAEDVEVPDDIGALLEGLADAPREASAQERLRPPDDDVNGGADDDGPNDAPR